jgi:hypothetical protein
MKKRIIGKFHLGLATFAALRAAFVPSYPYPFPEKSLTFDWDNINSDMKIAIEKIDYELANSGLDVRDGKR